MLSPRHLTKIGESQPDRRLGIAETCVDKAVKQNVVRDGFAGVRGVRSS